MYADFRLQYFDPPRVFQNPDTVDRVSQLTRKVNLFVGGKKIVIFRPWKSKSVRVQLRICNSYHRIL